uniref:Transposase n=1 Tax=Heterorhabditis bacteriophora TaxID=37862 RepID=A0A1I7X3L3_HETBA
MQLTSSVSGNGFSLVSGNTLTNIPAKSEKIANIIIGTMGKDIVERRAMYDETPEPKRATLNRKR